MFKRNDAVSIDSTSYHGVEITASLKTLVRLFSTPVCGGDKTKHEWILEGETFNVAVYDYRYNGAYEGHWHVGSATKAESLEFARWFRSVVSSGA